VASGGATRLSFLSRGFLDGTTGSVNTSERREDAEDLGVRWQSHRYWQLLKAVASSRESPAVTPPRSAT
jgi:hypothetical protein